MLSVLKSKTKTVTIRLASWALAALLLGGCAPTAKEVKSDRTPDLNNKGVLAVSLTSSGIPYLFGLQFFYTPPGGGEEVAVVAYSTDSPGYWSDYY